MKFDNFCDLSYTAQSSNADCERSVCYFRERVQSNSPKNRIGYTLYKTPGILRWYNYGTNAAVRGMYGLNGHVFAAIGNVLQHLSSDATLRASYGPIGNDGKSVFMAASPETLVFSSANTPYMISGEALTQIVWMDAPVSSVGFINTYFLFLEAAGGGFFYSEPGNANDGDPSNFISAEASANKYIALLVDREEIWLFGNKISQVFYDNSANDPVNPFLPNLSAVIPYGTCAPESPIAFGGRVAWLSRDESGQGIALATDGGYLPSRISNFANEWAWSQYPTLEDAVSYKFTIKGHPMWRLYFPSANNGLGSTWEYDATVGGGFYEVLWWNALLGQYEAHRGRCAAAEFESILVGDRENGRIYKMSLNYLDDDGEPIRAWRRAPIISNEDNLIGFPFFQLDMKTGVGRPRADWVKMTPPAAPALAAGAGTIPAGTYYVRLTFWNNLGETFSSEATSIVLGAPGGITVTAPTPPTNHISGDTYGLGYKIYAETVSGAEKIQAVVTGFTDYTMATINSAPGTATPDYPVTDPDPQAMLKVSQDWGQNFGSERMRSLGRAGQYKIRVIWRRNGMGRQTVFDSVISDPVEVAINNALLREPDGRRT